MKVYEVGIPMDGLSETDPSHPHVEMHLCTFPSFHIPFSFLLHPPPTLFPILLSSVSFIEDDLEIRSYVQYL